MKAGVEKRGPVRKRGHKEGEEEGQKRTKYNMKMSQQNLLYNDN